MSGSSSAPIRYSAKAVSVSPADWNDAWTDASGTYVMHTGTLADVDLGSHNFTTTGNITIDSDTFQPWG